MCYSTMEQNLAYRIRVPLHGVEKTSLGRSPTCKCDQWTVLIREVLDLLCSTATRCNGSSFNGTEVFK
jgi:hypothetical protein